MKMIDLTLKVTPKMTETAQSNLKKAFTGHLGTHFDVMNKEFPLEYTSRKGILFDIRKIRDRDVEPSDIDMNKIEEGMFVAFYSGFINEESYGTQRYYKEHPQLSMNLIEKLMEKKISIIAIDFAGVRLGKEHTPTDQLCADDGVFVIENLCNLDKLYAQTDVFTARTYPMNFAEMTGLPCRVVAEF